jgi:hypothetical protein
MTKNPFQSDAYDLRTDVVIYFGTRARKHYTHTFQSQRSTSIPVVLSCSFPWRTHHDDTMPNRQHHDNCNTQRYSALNGSRRWFGQRTALSVYYTSMSLLFLPCQRLLRTFTDIRPGYGRAAATLYDMTLTRFDSIRFDFLLIDDERHKRDGRSDKMLITVSSLLYRQGFLPFVHVESRVTAIDREGSLHESWCNEGLTFDFYFDQKGGERREAGRGETQSVLFILPLPPLAVTWEFGLLYL